MELIYYIRYINADSNLARNIGNYFYIQRKGGDVKEYEG